MGQLFFAAFDQSQRAAVVFAARLGYLRAGGRVVSHQELKPFTQILAIGRVLSTRLSAIRSATAERRPMDARMADGILRSEGREIRVPAEALKTPSKHLPIHFLGKPTAILTFLGRKKCSFLTQEKRPFLGYSSLENSDISPSDKRNKIIASKIGS